MNKKTNVELDKIYSLPNFKIVSFKNSFIVVFINIAKWIVLNTKSQLNVFRYLVRGHSINDCLKNHKHEDVVCVLTQLEAKHIESTIPKSMVDPKLHLHITNACNLRCPHCYMYSGKSNNDELTTSEIKTLIAEFSARGGRQMSFTGGEPLLRKDLFELISYASDKSVSSTIFTNGCLWTESDIKKLSHLKIDGVQISIDGYDDKSNSVFRGLGSFAKSLNTVSLLIKNGIKVSIAVTAPFSELKSNPQGYVNFANDLIKEYKNNISIDFSHSFMPGRELPQQLFVKYQRNMANWLITLFIKYLAELKKQHL